MSTKIALLNLGIINQKIIGNLIMIKIICSNEEEKQELLTGSEHIHDLQDLDTDIPGANFLAHMYTNPELIEVIQSESDVVSNSDSVFASLLAKVALENPSQLEFALQLLGLSPCPNCNYIKKCCKCEELDAEACMNEVLNRC